jgi:hypothetical protein
MGFVPFCVGSVSGFLSYVVLSDQFRKRGLALPGTSSVLFSSSSGGQIGDSRLSSLALNLVESLGWRVESGDSTPDAKFAAGVRQHQSMLESNKVIAMLKQNAPPLPANPLAEMQLNKKREELLENASSNWNGAIRGLRDAARRFLYGGEN